MATSRAAVRSLRSIHARPQPQTIFRARPFRRAYADTASQATSNASPAIVGGLVGGGAVFAAAYGWYYFSGAKTAINTLHTTKSYFDSSVKKIQDSTPEPNEALQWLRTTALSYSAIIPGAKGYVNSAFDDLDSIRDKHGDKVDAIVKETYTDVKKVTQKEGMSLSAASQIWAILESKLKDITSLAGDAAEDIMNNHPEIKKKLGGNIDQLKEMGERYGPEAKEQVDKTWEQIGGIVKKGFTMDTVSEIKKVVQEKMEMLQKLGDEAFKKGMEQAKPYLDKSPKIKELIEKNKDALKSGDISQLWEKVKDAASSGNTDDLEKFVKSTVDKGKDASKSMGVDVDQYLKMVPGMDGIGEKLKQLQDIGQKHGKEAQDILKSTMEEVQQVLSKKVQDAQKLAEKAKNDSSK